MSSSTALSPEQMFVRLAQGLDPLVQTRDVGSPPAGLGNGLLCKDAARVLPAGGDVVARLLSKSFTPFERRFRKVPPAGAYLQASADSPVSFELGSYPVPTSQALFVADYSFQAFRVGPSSGDPIPLEPERLSTSLGYVIGGRSMSQVDAALQLLPTPVQDSQQQVLNQNTLQVPWASSLPVFDLASTFGLGLTGPAGPAGSFPGYPENPTTFNQAAGTVPSPSTGSPVLPQSRLRVGARDMPFALYFTSSDSVQLLATVYSPLTTPLAYIEGVVSGFLVNSSTLESLLHGVRPCT